ncbi:MAG: thrombospondin type 3 repeat-containing protein [Deltaproteobacteria bacterium]|nr:thrombospondin type 3 repeat-containing protein [Deltaproteobacteria bacterium]
MKNFVNIIKINLLILMLALTGISSAQAACGDNLFLRGHRVGVEYDQILDSNNLNAPSVTIPGDSNRLAAEGEQVSLSLNANDADGDNLHFFWRLQGSCDFSLDVCNYASDYSQILVTVNGGVNSSCVVRAFAADGKGKVGSAVVSFMQDSDNDTIPNPYDAFPNDPNEWKDSDGDGIGDSADNDDDNDGVPDGSDLCPLTNPQGLDFNNDGCADTLGLLVNSIDTLVSHHGIANSLKVKLEAALKSCQGGRVGTAQNQLEAFIHEVQAQSGKHISEEVANLLINMAQALIDALSGASLDQNLDDVIDVCAEVSSMELSTIPSGGEAVPPAPAGCSLRRRP